MTDSYLKSYNLVAQTLSPIHIGSGVKLGKADFIQQNGLVHIIDETKMMTWIIGQTNAEQLALILADDLRRPESGIEKFLKERFQGNLSDVIAYSLPYQGSPKDISAFIKQADNQAYIPGSSIKGVLRSGLLRGKMLGDEGLRQKAVRAIDQGAARSGKPKTNSDQIQANLFVQQGIEPSRWSNYDLNRVLLIRDSEAIPAEDLEIVAVKTLSVQYDQSLKPKPYPIFVEVLPAGQRTNLAATLQTNLFQDAARSLGLQKLEDLMVFLPDYCRRVSQDLLSQELNFYERHGRSDLAEWFQKRLNQLAKSEGDVFILPMGWGSGYDAKTITDLLGEETFEQVVDTYRNTSGLGKPGRNKDAEWLGLDDSPKSRKIIERPSGKVEPMGWVAYQFAAAGEDDWFANQRDVLIDRQPLVIARPAKEIVIQVPGVAAKEKTAEPAPRHEMHLIEHFTSTPKIGECFSGEVFEVTGSNEIRLAIPDIEDVDAYAVLLPGTYPALMKNFKVIKCQVTGTEADKTQKNCVRVLCKAL